MPFMKTILIALDYDSMAPKIAEKGYALAKAMNARTILLHVVADPAYYASINYSPIFGFGGFSEVMETDTTEELKDLAKDYLDRFKQHLGDDMIELVIKTGDFGEGILQTAKELKVDTIVMGTHSRKGLEKMLLGSVAEKVLHHSSIPLFIIPMRGLDKGENLS